MLVAGFNGYFMVRIDTRLLEEEREGLAIGKMELAAQNGSLSTTNV